MPGYLLRMTTRNPRVTRVIVTRASIIAAAKEEERGKLGTCSTCHPEVTHVTSVAVSLDSKAHGCVQLQQQQGSWPAVARKQERRTHTTEHRVTPQQRPDLERQL